MSQFYKLHFDQYQRYRFTQEVVDIYRNNYYSNDHTFRILDVGGLGVNRNGEYWLPMQEFLPNDKVIILDTHDIHIEGYVQGDGAALPFSDDEFDIVITNDVFEHIPSQFRTSFCDELTRVSKDIVILTAPFYTPVNALAEKIHYEYMVNQLNIDHGMLGEHLTNGTPRLEDTIQNFKENNYQTVNYGTGNLYNWLLFSFIKETVGSSNEILPTIEWIDSIINENFFESEMLISPAYRQTIVVSDSIELTKLDELINKRFDRKSDNGSDLSLLLQMFLQLSQLQFQNDQHYKLTEAITSPEFATTPLKDGDILQALLKVDENNLAKLSFLVGTHGKKQHGVMKIKLCDQDEIKYSTEISTAQMKDNDWYTVSFPPLSDSKGKTYTIFWQFFGEAKPGISLWCSNIGTNETSLFMNEDILKGKLCLKTFVRCFSLSEQYEEKINEMNSRISQLNLLSGNIQSLEESISEKVKNYLEEYKNDIFNEIHSVKEKTAQLNEKIDTTVNKNVNRMADQITSSIEQMEEYQYDQYGLESKITDFNKKIEEQEQAIADKERHIQNIEKHIKAMEETKGWKYLERLRRIRNFISLNKWRSLSKVTNKIRERGIKGTIQLIDEKLDQSQHLKEYDQWFRSKVPTTERLAEIKSELTQLQNLPLISIVMPTYNTDEKWLRLAIESVINQMYSNWELCICDDHSPDKNVWKVLQEYAQNDDRIKVLRAEENLGIAGSTNKAVELAAGEYVGFLDHDDELTVDALYEVVKVINREQPDMIYSDEDKLEMDGTYSDPFFKPDWSPDYLLSTNYICHFAVYKKEVGDRIGWINLGYDGAQDYDFVLRFTENANKIEHISKILYHWRKIPGSTADSFSSKSYAQDAGKNALKAALERRSIDGEVQNTKLPGHYRVKRFLKEEPLVSIIIPTKDRVDLLSVCVDSILKKTSYNNFEIIIVNNNSEEEETYEYFNKMKNRIKVINYEQPFNYSSINNFAVTHSKGEQLLFLNNDTEVIESKWLTAMVEYAIRPEVGVVGAKLLYTNNTIQHGGVILGVGGVANHSFLNLPRNADGYFGMLHDIRNCSAVTAACMMVRRDVYKECQGFNEKDLAVAFNDVDLCLRITRMGYLCVWTPEALLYHHESATRARDVDPNEVEYMRKAWGRLLDHDPYYNINFDRNEVLRSYSSLK
jgi:GT2 family glycosyltransferase